MISAPVPPKLSNANGITSRLKIGLLSQWYEPEPQTVPQVLAHELVRRQHSVKVLTGFPNYPSGRIFDGYRITWRQDEIVSDVAVRRVALYPSHDDSRLRRIANYATFATSASLWGTGWFKDIDALWVYNSPPTVALPTWFIKARYRPTVVLHIMDLWPESLKVSAFGKTMVRSEWLERALERWLSSSYAIADSIACTSRRQIEILVRRGVPPHKLHYAPTWVDEDIFKPMPRDIELSSQLGVADKKVLLYAGAIGEAQGLDTLVEACDLLRSNATFHCLIAGSGIAEQQLRRQAESKALTNISFIGRWPSQDMGRLMSIGDLHLVSLRADSLAEFALPSKLPATLACAKPVVVAAQGDAADVVRRANAGWTSTPGDPAALAEAINSALATSEAGLAAIGDRARRLYEDEFALKAGVDRVEKLLRGSDLARNQ